MQYKSIRNHSADLSKIFLQIDDLGIFGYISEWLRIASAIKDIDFGDEEYNNSLGYCESADNFDFASNKLLQRYVTDLTIFSFVWSSLECLIEYLFPEKALTRKKYGKIGSACYFITTVFDTTLTPIGYDDELSIIKKIVDKHPEFNEISKRFHNIPNHVNHQSTGLFVIYKLRNLFAHGALSFPNPENTDDFTPNFDMTLIEKSTRIVLFSLQMLLSAIERGKNLTIDFGLIDYAAFEDKDFDDDSSVGLNQLLKDFHLINPNWHQ